MSGICAVWQKRDTTRVPLTLSGMTGALSVFGQENVQTEIDGDFGLGLSARWSKQQIYRDARLLVACDADLFREDELWQLCGQGRPAAGTGNDTAALIAGLYE